MPLFYFQPKDILIANIRPYLKKIWFADIEGGCSSDVLVFRAKEGHFPNFLYATLMQDAFYDYVMKGVKGSKMPRGDKEQIMRYKMPTFSSDEEQNIGKIVVDIEKKLQLSRAINDNLEKMAKQLLRLLVLCSSTFQMRTDGLISQVVVKCPTING